MWRGEEVCKKRKSGEKNALQIVETIECAALYGFDVAALEIVVGEDGREVCHCQAVVGCLAAISAW